jgi:hypothetical protein
MAPKLISYLEYRLYDETDWAWGHSCEAGIKYSRNLPRFIEIFQSLPYWSGHHKSRGRSSRLISDSSSSVDRADTDFRSPSLSPNQQPKLPLLTLSNMDHLWFSLVYLHVPQKALYRVTPRISIYCDCAPISAVARIMLIAASRPDIICSTSYGFGRNGYRGYDEFATAIARRVHDVTKIWKRCAPPEQQMHSSFIPACLLP